MKRKELLVASCAGLACAAALLGSSCSSATKRADLNKDGKISTEELNNALVKAVFKAADENGNGSVTFEEWKQVFPDSTKKKFQAHDLGKEGAFTLEDALAYCSKNKTFDKLVAKIDSNGDGIIDKEEAGKFQDKMEATEGGNEVQKLKTLAN
jgi:Ca2+-binding EF-hand superfamily protein